MRLAIADPPYLGVAAERYGLDSHRNGFQEGNKTGRPSYPPNTDRHPEAHHWDDPETHHQLVQRLTDNYDGWAIAMRRQNLAAYLQWVPPETRICIWVRPNFVPSRSHVLTGYEPVLTYIPKGRLVWDGNTERIRDTLTATTKPNGFMGTKPPAWTRWILDMLRYDPTLDTVDDLFPGSGSVAAAIAQGVLL